MNGKQAKKIRRLARQQGVETLHRYEKVEFETHNSAYNCRMELPEGSVRDVQQRLKRGSRG